MNMDKGETLYQYVFVRKDLPPEQIVVQTTHAASKAATNRIEHGDMKGLHLIVLGAQNERDLINIMFMLEQIECEFDYFIEPDMNGGEITAVATGTVCGDDREFFRDFELLTIGKKKGRTVAKHIKARKKKGRST